MKMTDESERNVFRSLAQRAVPFLRDEGEKYDDDGSNEPLELAREIESAMASSPSDESALVSANSAFDGGLEAANLDDAKAFAALETARGSLHWTLADTVAKDMLDAMAYLAARLAADQQKGGGEVIQQHVVTKYRDGSVHVADAITTPQPSIPAPAQQDGKASGGGFDYTDIANRTQANTGKSVWPSTVKAVLQAAGVDRHD